MYDELKPCPFCGGLGELIRETVADEILYAVACSCWHCRVGPITDWYQTKEHAIEAWNKRAGETFNGEVMLMGDRVYLAGKGYFTKEER